MSNKTQLQANNEKYASLIEVLKTKGTPSGEEVTEETNAYTAKLETLETAITALETELEGKASGGSGGGSVETYSGTLSSSGMMPPVSLYGTLWYTDASLTIQNVEISSLPYSFTVVKNSIIYWKDQADISFKSGTNITQIYSTNMGASNAHAAIVPTADNFDIKLGM